MGVLMRRRAGFYWTASLLAIAMLGVAGTAQAEGRGDGPADRLHAPAMPTGGAALPPAGFLDLCARSPVDCVEEGAALPDLAALEASANRRLWSDLFQSRSAPAALPRPDAFDSSAVFANTAPRGVVVPAAGADGGVVSVADGLSVGSPTTFEVAEHIMFGGAFEAEFDALRIRPQPPARNDLAAAARDRGDVSDSAVAIPLETAKAADIETGAPSAADVGIAAVEVAAVNSVDGLVSPTDLPITRPANTHAEAVAAPVLSADAVNDQMPDETAVFTLDRDGWRLVNGVNRRLNREIRQASDNRLYGMEDFWTRPEGARAQGDCEDYVLAKRAALIAEGVPAAVLSIAIVETRWGESHAVLLLASDRGEFILDSLSPWVVRWDRVDYAWRERQMPGRPFDWVRIAV